jgi:aminoglycoside phosphotransferase family enzyme/predicted kinase
MGSSLNALVRAMRKPGFYDHPVDRVVLVETHVSWVFLAGDYAYKLKKPIDVGFLDFSTLELRRHFCHEELRLNRRFAPQLYLDVVSIGGSPAHPAIGKPPVLDYAVRMKRFPARQQLDRMQAEGLLTAEHVEGFATMIAHFHSHAPVVGPAHEFGAPETIIAPIKQNFVQIRPLLPAEMQPGLDHLERWSLTACKRLRPVLQQRKAQGFIRECHGDLHLGNMVWFDEEPLLFDCIEFSENLRWIDLINDIAFLVMDLDDRGEESFGGQFLNRYLQQTGDYPGMALLNFYKVYRAMVRAKVASLRLSQEGLTAAERTEDQRLAQSYLDLAARYTATPEPLLLITHGLSGAGKTTLVRQLAPCCGAITIHSDVERKRLQSLSATADSHSALGAGIYTENATTATYRRLQDLAESLLRAGFTTIVDATFIMRQPRDAMRQLANRLRVPLVILDFPLGVKNLTQRVEGRAAQSGQISEATSEVLQYQLAHEEPLGRDELEETIQVLHDMHITEVAERITERAGRLKND